MKTVKGNKITDLSAEEFNKLASNYNSVVVDLGTGDGRFVYKSAFVDSGTLFIGIDPAAKQMEEFSKKAARNKLVNALFVVGSLEQLPPEFKNCVDKLYIILPWGSLLKAISQPTKTTLEKISLLLKPDSIIEIVFGYDSALEPTEFERLELDKIDETYIKNEMVPVFESCGMTLSSLNIVEPQNLKALESTWGKRISQRSERQLFLLSFASQPIKRDNID